MVGGWITVWLVSSLTRLEMTNEGNIILFVFSEAVYCNLVKLETSCTVMLPPTVSVLWLCATSDATTLSLSLWHAQFFLYFIEWNIEMTAKHQIGANRIGKNKNGTNYEHEWGKKFEKIEKLKRECWTVTSLFVILACIGSIPVDWIVIGSIIPNSS